LVRSDIPLGGLRGPPGVRGSTQIVYDTYGLLKVCYLFHFLFFYNLLNCYYVSYYSNKFDRTYV